jgi:hypothetical protein
MKMLAQGSQPEQSDEDTSTRMELEGIQNDTIHIARLRLLMMAAKVATASNIDRYVTRSMTAEHRLCYLS